MCLALLVLDVSSKISINESRGGVDLLEFSAFMLAMADSFFMANHTSWHVSMQAQRSMRAIVLS